MRANFACIVAFLAAAALVVGEGSLEVKLRSPCHGARQVTGEDCAECGESGKEYVAKLDFYRSRVVLDDVAGQNFDLWMGFDDGFYSADCHGGQLDSNPFDSYLLSSVRWMDHFKYYAQALAPVPVLKQADTVFEYFAGAQTFNTDQSPYPQHITQLNDWRLAHGIFSVLDRDHFVFYAFYLTNDRVYIGYSRLPTTVDSAYARFEYVVPVGMRKPCDEHSMKIVFHGGKRQVSFRLEGREVFRILKPGYHLLDRTYMVMDEGGQTSLTWPAELYYGFGTGDSLDSYPACKRSDSCCDCEFPKNRMALANTGTMAAASLVQWNPMLREGAEAIYWRPYTGNVLDLAESQYYDWDQGVGLSLKKLVIYHDYCGGRKC